MDDDRYISTERNNAVWRQLDGCLAKLFRPNNSYSIGDEVEVRDWMGGWNVGKVVDALVYPGPPPRIEYKVECCGLTCWLKTKDMRRAKR